MSNNEFPRMLYHPIQGQHIVKDEAECLEFLKKGWTKEVVPPDEESILKARITETETDLSTMRSNLAHILGEEYDDSSDRLKELFVEVTEDNEKMEKQLQTVSEEVDTLLNSIIPEGTTPVDTIEGRVSQISNIVAGIIQDRDGLKEILEQLKANAANTTAKKDDKKS